jgi:hypothetical protein
MARNTRELFGLDHGIAGIEYLELSWSTMQLLLSWWLCVVAREHTEGTTHLLAPNIIINKELPDSV